MKKWKIIIAAAAATIFDTIIGGVCCRGVFNWVYKLEPTNVWKPMESAPGAVYYAGVLVLNIILASVYALFHKSIPAKNKLPMGCKMMSSPLGSFSGTSASIVLPSAWGIILSMRTCSADR